MDHDDGSLAPAHCESTETAPSVFKRESKADENRRLLKRIEENRLAMTPENRALFDSIRALADKIGPGDFDINEAIRELRGDE
jgi:hypothetical protein